MPLIDLLRPDQRAALRRLRKKIANRENMRRYRAENRDKMLCAGVDLPLEAGTCGRLVWPESERCIACRKRRAWLLRHALNPPRSRWPRCSIASMTPPPSPAPARPRTPATASPCSTTCPHSATPACAGERRTRARLQPRREIVSSAGDVRAHTPRQGLEFDPLMRRAAW